MKSRIISILLSMAMLVMMMPTSMSYADDDYDAHFYVERTSSSATVGVGENVQFTISSDAIENSLGVVFYLYYDPTQLECVSRTPVNSTMTTNASTTKKRVSAVLEYTHYTQHPAGKMLDVVFKVLKPGTINVYLGEGMDDAQATYTDPNNLAFIGEYKVGVSNGKNNPLTITGVNLLSGAQAATGLTAPVKNAAPDTEVTAPANTTASVKWYVRDTEFTGAAFAAGTQYTAKVTLTPASGYKFATGATGTIDGNGTSAINEDGTMTITYTYPATAAKEVTVIAITTAPTKTSYVEGQKFSTSGMVVTATYDDGTSGVITDYTLSPSADTALKTTDTAVTVSYGGKTASQSITVVSKAVTGLAITSSPTKTAYKVGDTLDTTGLVVTATYNDGTSETISAGDLTITGFDSSKEAASQAVTVSYGGKTASFNVSISKTSISADDAFSYTAPSSLTYDGTAKTAAVAAKSPYNGTAVVTYKQGSTTVASPVNAGTYDVYVSAAATDKYGAIAETKIGSFTIAKKSITAPTASATSFTYDGTVKTVLTAGTGYTVSGASRTAAGSYTATALLSDKTNTQWSDGTTADKTYSWTIAKKSITAPTASATSFTYDGTAKTALAAGTGYTVSGGTATAAGSYTATASLSDKNNTQWSDGTTADKTYNWSIATAKPTLTISGIGSQTYGDTGVKGTAAVTLDGKAVADAGTVRWISSDPSVATVNASTGEVTILKAGSTVITAEAAAAAGKYEPATATATLTVAKKTLSVSNVIAGGKTYDGTTSAELTVMVDGVVGNDQVTVTADGTYDAADAGVRKVAVSNYQLTDPSGNYTLDTSNAPSSIEATIGKADASGYKAEISNTSQTAGSVTKPTVTVTPALEGAETKIYIKQDPAEGETEPTWVEWTDDTAPSSAGTYTIKAEVTSPNVDGTVSSAETTFTITKKSSGGGGGGGSSSVTTYNVNTLQSDGGEVKANTSKAEAGNTVIITATPLTGYSATGVTVTAVSSGKAIEATKNSDGTYSFTMPSGAVNVSATFSQTGDTTAPADSDTVCAPYSDIDTSKWYHSAVHDAIYDRIMTGTSSSTFTPNGKLTRAMLAQILYNNAGQPASATAANDFSDVKSGDWYASAVDWAAEKGVVKGYEDGTFRPNAYVTREELAAMLYRYAGSPAVNDSMTLSKFADAGRVATYAQDAVKWATANGIITGDGNTYTLNPKGTASRAQAAAMIVRYLDTLV